MKKFLVTTLLTASLTLNGIFAYYYFIAPNQNFPQGDTQLSSNQIAFDRHQSFQNENDKNSNNAVSDNAFPQTQPSASINSNPQSLGAETTSEDTLALWVEIQRLRGQGDYEELNPLLQSYLRANPSDVNALMLEAETIYYTQPLNVAIIHYYGLRELPLSREQRADVDNFIQDQSNRVIKQFSEDRNWQLLAAFLEPLLQIDGLNQDYILALALAYGMESQYSLMEDVLASLPQNAPKAQRLRDVVYASPDSSTNGEDVAPLLPTEEFSERTVEQSFRVTGKDSVILKRNNGKLVAHVIINGRRLLLLVDTGASITAISDRFSETVKINSEFLGVFRVQTAGGMIESNMYRIPSINLRRTVLNNATVMMLDSANLSGFDGLLGMNVLNEFDFVATNSDGDVLMRRKSK